MSDPTESSSSPAATAPELPPLREVIVRYGLDARKSLGQHFLLDINLTRRIARAAGDLSNGTIIEIGPGPGGLTRALLLEGAQSVVAVERDQRCVQALAELAGMFPGRLRTIHGDARQIDTSSLGPAPRRIVANLPYNISTSLLVRWLHGIAADPGSLESLTLMFQKEVADRLSARPNSKAYGRLSVITQWLCQVQPLFNLPAAAFTPPPKVASTVVQLLPRSKPLCPARLEAMEKITAAAFGQRRKMLRQSLKSLIAQPSRKTTASRVDEMLAQAGIAGDLRAENLSISDFCILARLNDSNPHSAETRES
jgi:16S rRNA (adenine1518-N6/adenine1519-N6)-dimethyltransferase